MLFLLAAGLTLVFGIMDMINLAHGSLYMLGAFLARSAACRRTGSFIARRAARGSRDRGARHGCSRCRVLRTLYERDHLSQVLATFALILIINEAGAPRLGLRRCRCRCPAALSGPGRAAAGAALSRPTACVIIARRRSPSPLLLYLLVAKTRIGMLVRAGASNREMALAMGVDIQLLFTLVFGVGAALCAVAGAMLAPLLAVQVGMGENILILAFVVIVIGGIGSIRGALVGRAAGRHRRHHRPRLPADPLRRFLPAARRERRRPGDRLGARSTC